MFAFAKETTLLSFDQSNLNLIKGLLQSLSTVNHLSARFVFPVNRLF